MAIVLFDNELRTHLYPLTLNRAVASLRFGILSIKERWELLTGEQVFVATAPHLQPLYQSPPDGEHVWIDAALMPDSALVNEIMSLKAGCELCDGLREIAFRRTTPSDSKETGLKNAVSASENTRRLSYPWEMIWWNDAQIRADFELLTRNRQSEPIPASVAAINPKQIFLEPGAGLQHCSLNAAAGPIYIGKNAEIMEGSAVRGPFVLGDHAVLKMNSRVYGATTIGPYCLGGGEIKNSVLMGYSNKAHDGYLGDSVVGEWCNFGAGSTNSNIKNTAGEIKLWNPGTAAYMPVGNKFGLIMGDYSRVAINSSINTGSVIGISSNVFGAGLLPSVIDSFSWGVDRTRYQFDKAVRDIANWKQLKGQELSEPEISILKHIFETL